MPRCLIKHAIERPIGSDFNVIVPFHAIDVLKKHLTDDEAVQISIANGRARFAVSDGQVTTSLINEKFPVYDGLLSRQSQVTQKLPLDEAITVVDRVTCVSDDKMVGVYPHEEGIRVALVGKSKIGNSDIIPADHPIQFTPVAFTKRLLGVALSSCSGSDVDLKFSGPEQPHYVADPGNSMNIRMLMSARVRL